MRRFYDRNRVEHEISVNYGAALRLRDAGLIDLIEVLRDPAKTEIIWQRLKDPETLVAVLVELLQVPAADVPEFLAAFDGDTFERAGVAVLEEIIDFFPQRQRQMVTAFLKSLTAWREKTGNAVLGQLEKMAETIDWNSVVSASGPAGNSSNA